MLRGRLPELSACQADNCALQVDRLDSFELTLYGFPSYSVIKISGACGQAFENARRNGEAGPARLLPAMQCEGWPANRLPFARGLALTKPQKNLIFNHLGMASVVLSTWCGSQAGSCMARRLPMKEGNLFRFPT
jgi:hypothetical protein